MIKQTAAGVVTQTNNTDGSSVTYDPSTGDITSSDGHLLGTTTTFNPNGSVSEMSPAGSTIWDSSGSSQMFSSFDGIVLPVPTSEPKPTAPDVPPSISLPHDPKAPAPESNSSDAAASPAPADSATAPGGQCSRPRGQRSGAGGQSCGARSGGQWCRSGSGAQRSGSG